MNARRDRAAQLAMLGLATQIGPALFAMLGLATQILPLAALDIAAEAARAFDTHRDHALIASTPLTTDGVPVQARLGAVHGSDDHCLATCLAVPGCNVVTRPRPDAPCLLDWGASCATQSRSCLLYTSPSPRDRG